MHPELAERHHVEEDDAPQTISAVNRGRIIESMSMLKRRLLSMRTAAQSGRMQLND
jgi:hypothetical protein